MLEELSKIHPQLPARPLPMIKNENNHKLGIDVFTLSRFNGVFPFNRSCKCTQFSLAATVLLRLGMMLFGVFSMSYALAQRKTSRSQTDIASAGVTILSEVLGIVILVVHDVTLIRDQKLIKDGLDVVDDYDCTINKSLTYGMFALTTKFILMGYFFHLRRKWHKTPEEFYYLVIHLQIYMVVLQFCSLLSKIHQKVSNLVKDMTLYAADFESHFELVVLLRGLNKTFGWQLLVVVFQIFLHATISLNWIAFTISSPEISWAKQLSVCANTLEAGYRFYTLSQIIYWCATTSEMVEAFNSKLLRSVRNSEILRSNEKLYIYANMRNNVVFTASGFFNLHYPLVTSIMAAAMTYLVILIQFTRK